MSEASSFAFRYPLNRNPYIAAENAAIYPYAAWGDYATSSNLYVYGRQIPFRSYFGQDVNLSARPISRVIQPAVLGKRIHAQAPNVVTALAGTDIGFVEYAAHAQPMQICGAPNLSPAFNNRFAAININDQQWGQQEVAHAHSSHHQHQKRPVLLGMTGGAQVASEETTMARNKWIFLVLALIAVGGAGAAVWMLTKK